MSVEKGWKRMGRMGGWEFDCKMSEHVVEVDENQLKR